MNPLSVKVTIDAPARGAGTQALVKFTPAECVCTWSWGLQPATALIDWVSATEQPAIQSGAQMTIEVAGGQAAGGHTFYGLCLSVVPVKGTDGISQMQEFTDSRYLLQADKVKGMFNMRDHRIVNGVFVRRYKHILPLNFRTLRETYTNAPYTARQILDFLFDANPDVETRWSRQYHLFLDNPVYELDYTSGRNLGQAILEISERLGLVFTLLGGRYNLVWTVKGAGDLPAFPVNSNNRRSGHAMSQNPTRIEVLGDRNRYQVMNIDMIPDWLSSWESFWDFNRFVKDIFDHEFTEAPLGSIPAGTFYSAIDVGNENNAGYLLARARAQTLTLEQYARLRDARDGAGDAFRDYRKFQNRSRLQMPVALYLSNLMFKAYRFSPGFTFRNTNGDLIGLTSVQLGDRLMAQVTHDPITGQMFYSTGLPSQPNGYAIVQGYSVAGDAFKTLMPEYFNIDNWISAQAVWQEMPFQIDNSGEGDQFILFDDPIIKSADLIQLDATGRYPTLNAAAFVTSPPVRLAVTLEAEKFSLVELTLDGDQFGNFRDEIVNVSGLSGEFVMTSPIATPFELAYVDGFSARYKAVQIATPLLNGQLFYDYGGYTVQGCNGTQLTSMIDRVTVRVNASGGISEDVDWTNERSRNIVVGPRGTVSLALEAEREFDRKAQLAPLLAGQAELRDQANQLRSEAGFLLKHPKISRMLMNTFHLLMGLDSEPDVVMGKNGKGGLPAGTPLFRDSTTKRVTFPNAYTVGAGTDPVTLTHPIFMGVTTVKNEPAAGPLRTTRTGQGNVIYARVKGPVGVGDAVGTKDVVDYLVASPTIPVGNMQEGWGTTEIRLAQVRVAGAGSGQSDNFQGVYTPGAYNMLDRVLVQFPGPNAGLYICLADGNTNAPYTGIGWIQVSALNQWF